MNPTPENTPDDGGGPYSNIDALRQWADELAPSDPHRSRYGTLFTELSRLRAQLRALTEEREALRKTALEDEQQIEALLAKVAALSSHETCACSYDRPGDICLHHSPALSAAQEARERAEALREFVSHRMYCVNWADSTKCTCGLYDLLATSRAPEARATTPIPEIGAPTTTENDDHG